MKAKIHLCLALAFGSFSSIALAQTSPQQIQSQGSAKTSGAEENDSLLDPEDCLVLLLDHQTGLFQTVKDVPLRDLRANTVVLAKVAELAKIPVITTASEPNGPNGPLMPELA